MKRLRALGLVLLVMPVITLAAGASPTDNVNVQAAAAGATTSADKQDPGYKKFSLNEKAIEVFYAELPPTMYQTDGVLKVKGGQARRNCASFMGKALTEAGFKAEGVGSPGVGDFSCEVIFAGTGKKFDEYMQKVKDVEGSFLASFLKGISILGGITQVVAGVNYGLTSGNHALGAGLATADIGVAQPNVATAKAAEASAKNGRLFGDNEVAIVSRVCAKDMGHCGFVIAVLHKQEVSMAKEDMPNLVDASKQGLVLAANVTSKLEANSK